MKETHPNDLIMAVVIVTILFFLMVAFILSYFIIYRRKKKEHRLEMQLAKEEYEKQLLQSQLEIQEQTFSTISQEIHDNVGQVLSLAKVQINIMNESDHMNREMLNEVKENIGKAMTDLRDIARSLSSDRIRSLSIYATVGNEVERINKSGILQASLSMEGTERKMDEQKKLILLRIIQESLQNIIKHAKASEIQILFHYLPDELQVAIQDNGQGFDSAEVAKRNLGLGLRNIRTRASLTGGTSRIESVLNQGTHIIINIPYE